VAGGESFGVVLPNPTCRQIFIVLRLRVGDIVTATPVSQLRFRKSGQIKNAQF